MFPQGETGMTDTTLSRAQALALLQRLATDDDFRARFEDKPAKALTEIGVQPADVVDLAGRCLHLRTLAPKEDFAQAVQQANDDELARVAAFHIPELRLRG
jgi:putative modified peptide